MLFLRCFVAVFALLCAAEALAQSYYRWVDDRGEVHYGQSVPPEFADYGYDRLGPDGSLRERVEPALTPEQIVERRRQRAEQTRLDAAERNRETRDRMLLATYSSEDGLREALDMQLVTIRSQRSATMMSVEQAESRFESQAGRAARLSAEGRPVPESLQQSIQKTRAELRSLRAGLVRLDEREAVIHERFNADLSRYRELTGHADSGG